MAFCCLASGANYNTTIEVSATKINIYHIFGRFLQLMPVKLSDCFPNVSPFLLEFVVVLHLLPAIYEALRKKKAKTN